MIGQYEGMFLVSPAVGETDNALEPVKRVLDRAGADVLACKNWDDRRLAYEIGGQRRGIYVLTYFKSEGEKIADIERDVQLDENLLRVLILRADEVGEEQVNKLTPAEQAAASEAERAQASESSEGESADEAKADAEEPADDADKDKSSETSEG